jgi:hypothetical protein
MNPKQTRDYLLKVLKLDAKKEVNLTPMVWGGAGVGKSSIIYQVGNELGYEVREIRLSTLSPVDVRGVPYVDPHNTDFFKFVPPSFLPIPENDTLIEQTSPDLKFLLLEKNFTIEQCAKILNAEAVLSISSKTHTALVANNEVKISKKPVLLFFDEINTAVPANQVVAYEIALNRRMGGHDLPKGTLVVMAGNRVTDRGATYEMPMPLANRLIHMTVDADSEEFIKWGLENGVDDSVVAFIKYRPNLLQLPGKDPAFPSPRSWEFVSTMMKEYADLTTEEVAGIIGMGAATEFMAFTSLKKELPDLDKILYEGEKFEHKQMDILYFYSVALSSKLVKDFSKHKSIFGLPAEEAAKFDKALNNYVDAISILDPEVQALALTCIRTDNKIIMALGKNRKIFNAIQKVLK